MGIKPGNNVHHRHTDLVGYTVISFVDTHPAGETLSDHVGDRFVFVGTDRAEAGDRTIDDRRVINGDALVIQAEAPHYAGAKTLNDNIATTCHALSYFEAVLRLKV